VLGPLAFVLILTRGLIDGGSAESVLGMAGVSLFAFSAIGYITGRIADRVLWDSLKTQFNDELQAHGSQVAGAEKTTK
jgi:hypothetical protein